MAFSGRGVIVEKLLSVSGILWQRLRRGLGMLAVTYYFITRLQCNTHDLSHSVAMQYTLLHSIAMQHTRFITLCCNAIHFVTLDCNATHKFYHTLLQCNTLCYTLLQCNTHVLLHSVAMQYDTHGSGRRLQERLQRGCCWRQRKSGVAENAVGRKLVVVSHSGGAVGGKLLHGHMREAVTLLP
jgi:hypothetical protein